MLVTRFLLSFQTTILGLLVINWVHQRERRPSSRTSCLRPSNGCLKLKNTVPRRYPRIFKPRIWIPRSKTPGAKNQRQKCLKVKIAWTEKWPKKGTFSSKPSSLGINLRKTSLWNYLRVWWTLTGNYGNAQLMPLDFNKMLIRKNQLDALNLQSPKVND